MELAEADVRNGAGAGARNQGLFRHEGRLVEALIMVKSQERNTEREPTFSFRGTSEER